MDFAIERTWLDREACIAVAGEVDVETAPRLREMLLETLDQAEAVVVDLGSVTFMDSTGLSALVMAQHFGTERGTRLRLSRVPPRVMKLLTITGLDAVLPVETLPTD